MPQVIREVKQQNRQKQEKRGISPHAPRANKGKRKHRRMAAVSGVTIRKEKTV
jgi:hypothetical protein